MSHACSPNLSCQSLSLDDVMSEFPPRSPLDPLSADMVELVQELELGSLANGATSLSPGSSFPFHPPPLASHIHLASF